MATRQMCLHFQGNELCVQPSSDSESAVKKRKCEYKVKWEEGREWLFFDNKNNGMFCKIANSLVKTS